MSGEELRHNEKRSAEGRCMSCGLELIGILVDGHLRPSNRPDPNARRIDLLCIRCVEGKA